MRLTVNVMQDVVGATANRRNVVGTAIEAPDPGALAAFYSQLLGWSIGHEEPGTVVVAAPQGRRPPVCACLDEE